MSPPRLPPVDRRHLLPGHLLHGCTVAGAGVPRRASTGTGGRCGRAALCAHGSAMPVTRLRARRLNRADAQSSGEGAARPPLCADEAGESWSGRGHRGCTQLEVCHTELALQNKTAVYNAIRTRPGKRTPTMCFPGKGSTRGRQKSWQPGDRTTCVRCNRTIFIHVATLGA